MLTALAQSLLLLFQAADGDEQLAFDCAPWKYNRWREMFGLVPLKSEAEEDEDVVDIGSNSAVPTASAADGFVFSPNTLKTVGAVTRQILLDPRTTQGAGSFMQSFWEQSCRDNKRGHSVDYTMATLPKDLGKDPTRGWSGYGDYRTVVLAMFNRKGGVAATVDQIMTRLGYTPIDQWKADRDVNRVRDLRCAL